MTGKVILVGAGPGDPGLLTRKGLDALLGADVVVYDRLVSPEILALMPERAEKIDVGKQAAHHKVPQEQINRILLEKALEGNTVVRLKGGDPFLFGRGGEELELLAAHGVPFEEIPGITSAIAAPAYGGIPVTHRDFCSSVHIVTGHARAGKQLEIDFEALVRTRGTLVFLMGVSSLPNIVAGLMDAGMEGSTPAAVVENGTTPFQRRLDGTLETLAEKAEEMQIQSPAVIIVGKVCALAEQFCWFEKLPLHGKRVLVTREKGRAGRLTALLRAEGAQVVEYPCIATRLREDAAQALDILPEYRWLVLTSPAGAAHFCQLLADNGKDGRYLAGAKIAAVGSATAAELKKYGLIADLTPKTFDGVALGDMLCKQTDLGRVLLLRAEQGSPGVVDTLRAAGVDFTDYPLYRTEYCEIRDDNLRQQVEDGKFDFVTFTSGSAVRGFVGAVGADADFSKIMGLCMGKTTANVSESYKIPYIIAKNATLEDLVALCKED